jgi:hypothetical protein
LFWPFAVIFKKLRRENENNDHGSNERHSGEIRKQRGVENKD